MNLGATFPTLCGPGVGLSVHAGDKPGRRMEAKDPPALALRHLVAPIFKTWRCMCVSSSPVKRHFEASTKV